MKFTMASNLGPWTRTTLTTKGVDSQLLLDLAVYPQGGLVVFINMPSDKILRRDHTQRLHSQLMYQAVRRFDADYRPKEFLFSDPPRDTDISVAQTG